MFVPSIKCQLLRGNRHFPHPWFFGELGGEIIIFDENKTKKNVHYLYIDLLYSRWRMQYSIFKLCRNYYFCLTFSILQKADFCSFLVFFLILVKVHEMKRFRTCSWNWTKKWRKNAGFQLVFSSDVLRNRKRICWLTSIII